MAIPAGAVVGGVPEIGIRGGLAKSQAGELYVWGLNVGDAIPAGYLMQNGLAFSPDGYLYVVFA